MNPEQVRKIIREELAAFIATDRVILPKHLQILDARNVQIGRGTGTSIGTQTTQKLSFYGVTPVVQASAISAPSGGGTSVTDAVDQSARSAINSIRTALTNMGITA